jgi:hypothetical protein
MVMEFPPFMEPEGSLSYRNDPTTGRCGEQRIRASLVSFCSVICSSRFSPRTRGPPLISCLIDHEKIPYGRMVRCGAGRMFTARWTRGLLLVGSMTHLRHIYRQTHIKQLRVACSEYNFTVYSGHRDNILD